MEKHYSLFKKGQFRKIIEEWKGFSCTLGRRIRVGGKAHVIEGQAIDVDDTGALVVRLDNGLNERVLAGDVSLVR